MLCGRLWECLGRVLLELQGPKLACSAPSGTYVYSADRYNFITLICRLWGVMDAFFFFFFFF